jgi:hypothetical protein
MGAVFLANRDDDQFRKHVTLKLLWLETDDPAVLARFRNERQILGRGTEHRLTRSAESRSGSLIHRLKKAKDLGEGGTPQR